MFSSLRSFVRSSHPLFRSYSATAAIDFTASSLFAPGNEFMRCSSLPQPPPQLTAAPSPSRPFPEEKSSDVTAATAAITSIIRSTPLSDLNAALLGSGLFPDTNLSSIIDVLIRMHSFDLAWSLLLTHPPFPLSAFASLFSHYSRAQMPSAAIRSFLFIHRKPHLFIDSPDEERTPLELLLDALCKEGYPKLAADFFDQLKLENPFWNPSVHCYNILLHGFFLHRNLTNAEMLWSSMRRNGVSLTVISYGIAIEGLCSLLRPDLAMNLFEEMKISGIDPNIFICNTIVDSLSDAGRSSEALGFAERFPLFGVPPNLSTYNSLIKGFCKKADLNGASNALKAMIERGILPTSTTYNHFFRFLAKFGKIEEAMNLYTKTVESGLAPDGLTYRILIKMHCEKESIVPAVQLMIEMSSNGFELPPAMSTMLLDFLCRLRRYNEACNVFEGMLRKGFVPRYNTYHKFSIELKRMGLMKMEKRVSNLMHSVLNSMKLPATAYRDYDGIEETERQKSILKKAEAMSEVLKERIYKDELNDLKTFEESIMQEANILMKKIRRRLYAVRGVSESIRLASRLKFDSMPSSRARNVELRSRA